jgi:hypothetical protein
MCSKIRRIAKMARPCDGRTEAKNSTAKLSNIPITPRIVISVGD